MPLKLIDYSKTIIYKIVRKDLNVKNMWACTIGLVAPSLDAGDRVDESVQDRGDRGAQSMDREKNVERPRKAKWGPAAVYAGLSRATPSPVSGDCR